MTLIDVIEKYLENTVEYSFDSGEVIIELPIIPSSMEKPERHERGELHYCGLNEAEPGIHGKDYGIHGEKAEEKVPEDYEWFVRVLGKGEWVSDKWIYGYFDSDMVLIRDEPIMAHRTATYYQIDQNKIDIEQKTAEGK